MRGRSGGWASKMLYQCYINIVLLRGDSVLSSFIVSDAD